ncbi:unnamed protein product [Nippostrongylus brasiliensis]|uniref:Secreted protein n=1 Tax=Nippostrongylus brasiliensis TaxID=27835 RepID=A0A0N4XMA5_NIPBR|nr:unnamed protein product [Nippostrongylus brasiliensis]
MLHKLSAFKKIGSIALVIYCFILLEFKAPISFLRRSALNDFITHEMSFLNFTMNYRYIMLPNLSICDGSHDPTSLKSSST